MRLKLHKLPGKIIRRLRGKPVKELQHLAAGYSSDLLVDPALIPALSTAETMSMLVHGQAQTLEDAASRKSPAFKPAPKIKPVFKPKISKVDPDPTRKSDQAYLLAEARVVESLLSTRLRTLGLFWSSRQIQPGYDQKTGAPIKRRGKVKSMLVQFERIYPTPDATFLKIRTQRRAGMFGRQRRSALPHGVRILDLISPDTLFELSASLDRRVIEWHDPNFDNGVWYVVYRTGSVAGLPKAVVYHKLIDEHYPLKSDGLTWIVGVSTGRKVEYFDLDSYPHWMVAGATGSGKSTLVNSLICQTLEYSHDTKLFLIDLKRLEFAGYKGLPGVTVANEPGDAIAVLEYALDEIHARTRLMEGTAKKIGQWNKLKPDNYLCRVVVVIDEFGELVLGDKKVAAQVFSVCARISQLGRAVGVHLVISTQHPSAEVIPSVIKINMAVRCVGRVQDKVQSRVALGSNMAAEIPEIPGRMIMMSNAHSEPIQTPNLLDEDIAGAMRARLTKFNPVVDVQLVQEPKLTNERAMPVIRFNRVKDQYVVLKGA